MERKVLLAIALVLLVLILPSLIFPPSPRPAPVSQPAAAAPSDTGADQQVLTFPPVERPVEGEVPTEPVETAVAEPVVVTSPLYSFTFSPRGARLVAAELSEYETLAAGEAGPAQLLPDDSDFLAYRLVLGTDTVSLADWDFEPTAASVRVGSRGAELGWVARRGAVTVRLTYLFNPNDYLFRVRGRFEGLSGGALVLLGLGPRLRSVETDSVLDFRSYGVVTRGSSVENLKMSSLDPGERARLEGPFEWVGFKSKYFLGVALTIDEGQPRFGGVLAVGGVRAASNAARAHVLASIPAPDGRFSHSVYLGPQEHRRLSQIGHDLDAVNPYGWILRPIIAPLSLFVVRLLLWMHETLNLAYGWVLVLFGIAVRLALWPLNQKAMRSTMMVQQIQPEMKEIQERYKSDRQKMQQEMMKLYKKHGMGPLGPLAGGCFPMLLQMPILFTLFFVFMNTIEFRGEPFLWLPDLSLADPIYVIPLVMGGSMFLLSKIGQIGVPPNPQQKMMTYLMPIVFTALFFRFSSGLNLYYATSTLASMPQQWLIAQERLRKARAGS